MTLLDNPARVTLVPGARASACEMCTSDVALVTTTLMVQHPRGGEVDLAVCDWCVQAVRRLAAVSGGHVAFTLSEAVAPPPGAVRATPRASRPAGAAIVIAELVQPVYDGTGTEYVPRVLGRERFDGTWEGWLEFVGVGSATVVQTGRETTQSKYEDLAYWARGLEPTYLRGAFARARQASSTG